MEKTENKEKVEYLSRYQYATTSIIGLRHELRVWKRIDVDIAQKYTDMPISGTGTSKQEARAVKIADILGRIDDELLSANVTRGEISKNISHVKSDYHKSILTLRYINGLDFARIASILKKDIKTIERVHNTALKSIKII